MKVLFIVYSIFNWLFFTNSVKLCGFKLEHFKIYFSFNLSFVIRQYTNFKKRLHSFICFYDSFLRKIIDILQFFQYPKIYQRAGNVGIGLISHNLSVRSHNNYRLLILKILYGDDSLMSVFRVYVKP